MYTPVITEGSKRFGNNRWHSFSPKLKRRVYLFSDLEYEHWLLIESDPNIVDFCEQPLKITNLINGKEKSSIPDMYIKYEDGKQEFREIKYSSDLNKANIIDQIATQRAWCNENGIEHSVRTEIDIRQNRLLLSNLKLILKTIKQYDTPTDIEKYKIQKIINKNLPQRISLQTLLQQSKFVTHRLFLTIGWMIINGEIQSNISKSYFGVNTEVWINE
ncbi:TnsA endonuclease N-terminal domain-containing protein [Virgibacillus sp. YIM 98842]|uniref:TnsA endonuclease N-terminal domain-containing protein n=1 Tax=Virgibacillus sp. YIM 98842 TaxID=2663533 RepID=UPI0013DAC5DA|nr:TnsA endonuclease N-terminal domain-containing protein [Virgibacillus sp. YIM 98842]